VQTNSFFIPHTTYPIWQNLRYTHISLIRVPRKQHVARNTLRKFRVWYGRLVRVTRYVVSSSRIGFSSTRFTTYPYHILSPGLQKSSPPKKNQTNKVMSLNASQYCHTDVYRYSGNDFLTMANMRAPLMKQPISSIKSIAQ
jgi:hypothetical protein